MEQNKIQQIINLNNKFLQCCNKQQFVFCDARKETKLFIDRQTTVIVRYPLDIIFL